MNTTKDIQEPQGNNANRVLPDVKRQAKLVSWLRGKIGLAESEGQEMFLGVPDAWWEKGLHCCNNGHIGTMYLKSEEKGSVCLTCHQPSHIFPSDATQEDLNIALS